METASHGTQPNLGQLATAKITVRTAQAQGNLETPRFSPGTSGPKKVTQSVALSLSLLWKPEYYEYFKSFRNLN
jgi:hypothetical protein